MALQKGSGLLVLLLSGAGLLPIRADAGLIGSDLGWQYYAGGGALGTSVGDTPVPGSVTGGSFIDSGGLGGEFIEPTLNGDLEPVALPVFDIDADDTTITFDYSVSTPSIWSNSPPSLSPTIDNGIAIDLLSAGSFEDVTLDPATNMTGFSASNFSFTGNQIEIDWSDLSFDTSTVVTLDVTYSETSAAPEPATYSLMLLSLLGVGLAARSGSKLR